MCRYQRHVDRGIRLRAPSVPRPASRGPHFTEAQRDDARGDASPSSFASFPLPTPASASARMSASAVSLGKGAWDCDAVAEIPPERESSVFEETATMDHPFGGLPTVPPRRDVHRLAVFHSGCRYLLRATVSETAREVKRRLREGGLGGGAEMTTGARPVVRGAVELFFAGERLEDDKTLHEQGVPPGCKCPRRGGRDASRAGRQARLPERLLVLIFAHARAHRQTLVLRWIVASSAMRAGP